MSARAPRCAAANATLSREHAAQRLCVRGRLMPTLFVIGSLKTGTTSLWSQLVDNTDGHITPGALTDKGDVSRKEKDFFGDPTMYRRGGAFYERIWPRCSSDAKPTVAIDATPAYHVWHNAPSNMFSFFGAHTPRLRLVWMLRDPVAKFWSYFWELKAYGGSWDSVRFADWVAPKVARTRECLAARSDSPLWPPSLPPPFQSCAPHLDHGLYEPQLRRWLQFFKPSQFLLVSFAGYARHPGAVVRDVLLHAGLPPRAAAAAAGRVRSAKKGMRNSKAVGHGRMPVRWQNALHALYDPFVDRLYRLIEQHRIMVTPCEHQHSRFLDSPNATRS